MSCPGQLKTIGILKKVKYKVTKAYMKGNKEYNLCMILKHNCKSNSLSWVLVTRINQIKCVINIVL